MAGSRYEYILTLTDKMTSVLRRVGSEGNTTYDKLQAKQERLNNAAAGFRNILAKIGAGFGAFALGRSIVTAGAQIESTRAAFEVLLGSLEKGNEMIAQIRDYGAKSPYEARGLMENAKMMLGFNIAGSKVMGTMRMLGDVAMGSQEKMNSLTLAYSQVMSAGKLQGQDLLQMINVGFNPLGVMAEEMSKTLGITAPQAMMKLRKEMEQGRISAEMVEATFRKVTSAGGRFYGMADKQGLTLAGRWATLKDNIGMVFTEVGERSNGSMKRLVEVLISATDWLQAHIGGIMDRIAAVFNFVSGKVSWFFNALKNGNPIVIAFTSIITGLTGALVLFKTVSAVVIGVTKVWTAVQAAFNFVMALNPVFLIVAGIIALIAAIGYVIYKTDGWGKTWGNVMSFIKSSFELAKEFLRLKWLQVQDIFLTGFGLIEKGWYKLQSLWNKDSATAGLNRLEKERNERAEAIAASQNKLDQLQKTMMDSRVIELSWNKNKSLTGMVSGLKAKLGMNAPHMAEIGSAAGSLGAGSLGGADSTIEGISTGISGGGSRPTNITINLSNLVENLNVTSQTLKESASEIELKVREALLRVLNSANGVAYGN